MMYDVGLWPPSERGRSLRRCLWASVALNAGLVLALVGILIWRM
jgi:hypothetical protein